MPRFVNLTATIPRDASLSNVVDCSIGRPIFIHMPPAWTSALLSFQVSSDGVAFNDLFTNKSQELSFNVASGTSVRLNDAFWAPVQYVKVRSGSRDKAIPQAAARDILVTVDTGEVPAEGPPGPAGPAGPAGPTAVSANAGNLAKLGTDSLILVPNTLALRGIVDAGDAALGVVGEVISSSNFGGVALTTTVAMNVTQITLSPGDWNVGGVVIFTPTGTGPNAVIAALSQTAATLPSDNDVATGKGIMQQIWASSMPSGKTQTTPTSLIRINTNAAKPVYLVALATFGGGSVSVTGYISARRVR